MSRDDASPPRRVGLIHGLGRGAGSMRLLAARLAREGFVPVTVEYPSTRVPIDAAEATVRAALQDAGGREPLDLVGHSLGGVLALRLKVAGTVPIRRVVQLGPPNLGSPLAATARALPLGADILGPVSEAIAEGDLGDLHLAPSDQSDLGIIAGRAGWLPFTRALGLDGENDGKVSVASALGVPHGDAIVLDVGHGMMPLSGSAAAQTTHFLRQGRFDRSPP